MRLYLVRHGQTAWNANGRAQGHSDIPLDDTGRRQSEQLARNLSRLEIQRILSSDLTRARDTAGPLADAVGRPVEFDPRLRERGFGDWEGRAFREIAESIAREAERLGVPRHQVRAPGGESIEDVWNRLGEIAVELRAAKVPTVVVTHGGSGALLLARLLGGPIELGKAFRFGNTAVTELEPRFDGTWFLARYNDTTHCESFESNLAGSLDGTHR